MLKTASTTTHTAIAAAAAADTYQYVLVLAAECLVVSSDVKVDRHLQCVQEAVQHRM